jgi:hypothetical protein
MTRLHRHWLQCPWQHPPDGKGVAYGICLCMNLVPSCNAHLEGGSMRAVAGS